MPLERPGSVHLEKQNQIPREGLLSELKIRDNLDLIRMKRNLTLSNLFTITDRGSNLFRGPKKLGSIFG